MRIKDQITSFFNTVVKEVDNKKKLSYELTPNGDVLIDALKGDLSKAAGIALNAITDRAKFNDYIGRMFCALSNDGIVVNSDTSTSRKSYNELYQETKNVAKDFYSYSTEFPFMLGEILTYLVRKPLEAQYTGLSLLKTLPLSGSVIGIDLEYFNATCVAARVGNQQEYPTGKFSTKAFKYAGSGRVGVRMNIPDQVRSNAAGFPVLAWITEEAVDSIYRYRENEIFDMITNSGTLLFDNASGSYNNTSGRNSAGVCNATFTQQDLFTMVASLVDAGYMPNTLLISPMTWLLWSMDPYMRMFGFWNGQNQFAKKHEGDPGNASAYSAFGASNIGSPYSPVNAKTTYTSTPDSFPYPIDVVVSPYMAADTTAGTCTITLADRNQLGIYVETDPLRTVEWPDPEHDSSSAKWDLGYFLLQSNEGLGIRKAQNVVYNQVSYHFGPENTFRNLQQSGDLAAPGTSAIL